MRNTDKKKQKENNISIKGYNKMENEKCRERRIKKIELSKVKKAKCKKLIRVIRIIIGISGGKNV